MKLPHDLKLLKRLKLDETQLMKAILERRVELRSHRDQVGDNRCHYDDLNLFDFLADSPPKPTKLPMFHIHMQHCTNFFYLCRADAPDPTPSDAILDQRKWDEDLKQMRKNDLFDRLYHFQQEILILRDIPIKERRNRNIEDYRRIYRECLPEKITANFMLPPVEDFLEERAAPEAGCPSFWRSHGNCPRYKVCDLNKWGFDCPAFQPVPLLKHLG